MLPRTLIVTAAIAGVALTAAPAVAQQSAPGGPSTIVQTPPPPPPPPTRPFGPQDVGAIPAPPGPTAPPVASEQIAAQTPVNLATIVSGISSRLTNAVGYAYTITRDGQVVAEEGVGDRRRPVDGQRDFKPTTRLEVMSVTKNMTAIALLKLLHQKGSASMPRSASTCPSSGRRARAFASTASSASASGTC